MGAYIIIFIILGLVTTIWILARELREKEESRKEATECFININRTLLNVVNGVHDYLLTEEEKKFVLAWDRTTNLESVINHRKYKIEQEKKDKALLEQLERFGCKLKEKGKCKLGYKKEVCIDGKTCEELLNWAEKEGCKLGMFTKKGKKK